MDTGLTTVTAEAGEASAVRDRAAKRWHALYVVAKRETATFEALTDVFAGEPSVRVVFDRREGERRHEGSPATVDRRERQRRMHDVSGDLETFGWALVLKNA